MFLLLKEVDVAAELLEFLKDVKFVLCIDHHLCTLSGKHGDNGLLFTVFAIGPGWVSNPQPVKIPKTKYWNPSWKPKQQQQQ